MEGRARGAARSLSNSNSNSNSNSDDDGDGDGDGDQSPQPDMEKHVSTRFALSTHHMGTLTDSSDDDAQDSQKHFQMSDTTAPPRNAPIQYNQPMFNNSFKSDDENSRSPVHQTPSKFVETERSKPKKRKKDSNSTGVERSSVIHKRGFGAIDDERSKSPKLSKGFGAMDDERSRSPKHRRGFGANDEKPRSPKRKRAVGVTDDEKSRSPKRRKGFGATDDERSRSPKRRKGFGATGDEKSKTPKRKGLSTIEFTKIASDDESSGSDSPGPRYVKKKIEIKPPSCGYGVGEKIMKRLGYTSGEGLGKSGQGRAEPIDTSMQHGRRGLGFVPSSQGKPYEGSEWDPKEEYITVKEVPEWIDESPLEELDRDLLDSWVVVGKKKLYINDEANFCDPKILEDVLSLKTIFDDIKSDILHTLVSRCNLYETIKNAFFINRAALKMANMDAVFDFMFTNPKTETGAKAVSDQELLYFADVCAGPGGFTEYVLWRKKWAAKGFGFTLKGDSDFNIAGLRAASTESFFPYYGENDDGDIFNPGNLASLKKFVLNHTEDKGVHFLMADGGFSVEGEENIQEIKSKQLYLCQCIAALSLVRDGGHFVVKLFDCFTKFSIGLIYLMYRSFKRICIHKPVTSRPANSERYLICKWKRKTFDNIERHLFDVNARLWKYTHEKSQEDIVELVPLDVLRSDAGFFNYMCRSNNIIGRGQIISLLKIKGLHNDRTLLDFLRYEGDLNHEDKKADIRKKCLEFWEIPDTPKKKEDSKRMPSYRDQLQILVRNFTTYKVNCITEDILSSIFNLQPKMVNSARDLLIESNRSIIKSKYDWYFMFCDSMKESRCNFYFSLGGYHVYRLEGRCWRSVRNLSLPEGTMFFGELVEEKRGTGRGIHSSQNLHILDAFRLGHEYVFNLCLKKRNQRIKLFCDAVNKPIDKKSETVLMHIRSKNIHKLIDITTEIPKLTERVLKNSKRAMTAPVPNLKENNDSFFVVESVLFFKYVKDPWTMALSTSRNLLYMHNSHNNEASYNIVEGSTNNAFDAYLSCFKCQFYRDPLYYDFLLRDTI
ncbi:cap methyltransferase 1 [Arctopsyche grandis]|uniref:cap methyltransferase 1 n=1 Tax=Arctopsyche grandis TaxID=121162 RepID=UPI00406D76DF